MTRVGRLSLAMTKPKEYLTMSKYLHLSLGMCSDIEVMLAKKISFNRIVGLSLHMYATDAKIGKSATEKKYSIGQ